MSSQAALAGIGWSGRKIRSKFSDKEPFVMRVNHVWSGLKPYCAIKQRRWSAVCAVVLAMAASMLSQTTAFQSTVSARPRITQEIDSRSVVTLHGSVRRDLTPDRDMGVVEDGLQLRLYLVLQRSPEQQAALDNLLARQQQPTAPEYHKWLTPREFGQRFGASPADIAKISAWLETQGMHVNGVMNNATFIDFSASALQLREVFRTQLHYYNIQGGRYAANAQDPVIPAALAPVVAGIKGLNKIPGRATTSRLIDRLIGWETGLGIRRSWLGFRSPRRGLCPPMTRVAGSTT